jgi:hypothetical protein
VSSGACILCLPGTYQTGTGALSFSLPGLSLSSLSLSRYLSLSLSSLSQALSVWFSICLNTDTHIHKRTHFHSCSLYFLPPLLLPFSCFSFPIDLSISLYFFESLSLSLSLPLYLSISISQILSLSLFLSLSSSLARSLSCSLVSSLPLPLSLPLLSLTCPFGSKTGDVQLMY